jgi:oligopeptidase B
MPDKKPVRLEIHGDVRSDEYFWLRERDNPDVIAYLEEENAHTEEVMRPLAGLQKTLFDEMKARIKQEDQSAPYRHGDYFYYQRYEKGSEYPVYARKKGSLEAEEEVLLDVNELAGSTEYFALRGFKVSPDHRIAVYGVDTRGRRFYDLYFLDLESKALLGDQIEDVTSNFEWANDSRTLLYAVQHPETLRSYRVYSHELGSESDKLVYEEADETNYLDISKSLSGRFFYLVSSQTLSTEVRYLSADSPADDVSVFLPREANHEYFVTDGADRFFIVSNAGAENFRVLETPLDDTRKSRWREVVAHRRNALVEDIEVFDKHLVVSLIEDGLSQLEVIDRSTGAVFRPEFDEGAYTVDADDNFEYETTWFRYAYESMTTPDTIYDLNMDSREHKLIKEEIVLGGFDRDNYESRRLFATARDGARVPVSLVYRKGMQRNGRNPLLQYGYGSYGYSIEPDFDADRLSLLDRGFIYAIAHIRGGSELGRNWYYDGRQLKKKNTFTDFIDVSEYLVEQGFTSPEHLYAEGGSAGGLLMGAVVNMAPGLYNGIGTRVPFVDVVTTMLDDDIPLTSGEWDEWGNPQDEEYYEYMLSYSPYDNVQRMDYPNMLVTTGLHDSQVQYWEPAKWVARLREYKTDDKLLLLKTDMGAGHSGKTGRFKPLQDTALEYSFFLSLEGIKE